MRLTPQSRLLLLVVAVAFLAAAAALWRLCIRNDGIAFLPGARGAGWIIYPKPAEGARQRNVPLSAVFRRSFTLNTRPEKAVLVFRSFKSGAVTINERPVQLAASPAEHWKSAVEADAAGLLQPGTNILAVWVTNSTGPPALWLRLEAGPTAVATDETWEVSLAGAAWQNARLAKRPPEISVGNPLYGGERTLDSVGRIWPALAVAFAVSLALVLLVQRCLGREIPNKESQTWIYLLLMVVLLARAALFVHNLPLLPRSKGFDSEAHQEYVQFIQQRHALPLAKDGWEMFQPPLYYLTGAVLLGVTGLSITEDEAAPVLAAINGLAGLVHCWLALLCLRLLFPGNPQAQAVGLLLAAFLPPHVYLSQYITNEPLAGLFVTAAFYCFLRALGQRRDFRPSIPDPGPKSGLGWHVASGAALGAAMLTKFSSLLPAALFVAAATRPWALRTGAELRDRLRNAASVLVPCVLVCGWHYLRVWAHSGKPLVGNWEPDSPFAWWQDPGLRTSAFYLGFGQALVSPLFSALHTFADGLYSTLWGDGLAGGAIRLAGCPPWSYDWMNAGYLLALPLSLVLLVGLVVALASFARQPGPEWLVVLGTLLGFGLAILYMSLRVPSYAQVKAFYAFPALVPLSAVFATGWYWLARRSSAFRSVLWVLMTVWSMSVCAAFWIRTGSPATLLAQGLYSVDHLRDAEAVESLTMALQLNEAARNSGRTHLSKVSETEAHFTLGLALDRKGKAAEAARQYREALRVNPDFHGAQNNLAWILASSQNERLRDGPEAVRLSVRACDLTHYLMTPYIGTLAAAYAEAGRFEDAIATAQRAIQCAQLRNEQDLAERNRELLELYQAHKPFRDSTADELR